MRRLRSTGARARVEDSDNDSAQDKILFSLFGTRHSQSTRVRDVLSLKSTYRLPCAGELSTSNHPLILGYMLPIRRSTTPMLSSCRTGYAAICVDPRAMVCDLDCPVAATAALRQAMSTSRTSPLYVHSATNRGPFKCSRKFSRRKCSSHSLQFYGTYTHRRARQTPCAASRAAYASSTTRPPRHHTSDST